MKDDTTRRKLVREVEVARVRARIWQNQSDAGIPTYEVSIVRHTTEVQGGTRESTFLGRDDLLLAARALDVAHEYICRLEEARGVPP